MDERDWKEFINEIGKCRVCHNEPFPIVDSGAHPLFMKECPTSTDLLFIAEAPNYDDTYNKEKGYLTVNDLTDPSGRFMYKMITEVLGSGFKSILYHKYSPMFAHGKKWNLPG